MCEGFEIRLALTEERANGAGCCATALARNGRDSVPHQFTGEVRHAEQVVFDWQGKVLDYNPKIQGKEYVPGQQMCAGERRHTIRALQEKEYLQGRPTRQTNGFELHSR